MARRAKSEADRVVDAEVGAAVERVRKQRRITQAQLAAQLGVSTACVYDIEIGETSCTAARLKDIARALSVPVQHLIQSPGNTQDFQNSSCSAVKP